MRESMELAELETLLRYARAFIDSSKPSLSLEELAKLWGKELDESRKIVRKLRREGFVKRTRSGRYKLTLAGSVLVRLYERVKRG